MARGKREAEPTKKFNFDFDLEKIPFEKIGIIAAIIAVIIIIVAGTVHIINKNKEAKSTNAESSNVQSEDKNKMPEKYEGYSVLGELVIEKIGLDKYIVDSTEDSAMGKAPAKIYGDKLNQTGNFCIAGHNYDEVFAKLNELKVGDQFYISDKDDVIQDYEVKEILEVEPTDLKVLMPVEDKIQVTLITCIEGATKRLVVVAERINIEG